MLFNGLDCYIPGHFAIILCSPQLHYPRHIVVCLQPLFDTTTPIRNYYPKYVRILCTVHVQIKVKSAGA